MKSSVVIAVILTFTAFTDALPGPWVPLPPDMTTMFITNTAAQYYGKMLVFPLAAFGAGWNGSRMTRFRVHFFAFPPTPGIPLCMVYVNWEGSSPIVTKRLPSGPMFWPPSIC